MEDKSAASDANELFEEFTELWADADTIWEQNDGLSDFAGYVSADYESVFESLLELRGRAVSFLEWGSGLGVVAIMASRLGFEAYGIESEPLLVEYADALADKYGVEPRFEIGSFVPEEYEWDPSIGDEPFRTVIDIASAYDSLDMQLSDFDLIYAFPWPDEHTLFRNIVKQCGRENSLFLSYDTREGMELTSFRDRDR